MPAFEWALPVCVYTQEVVGLEGKSGKSFVTPLIWVYIVPYNICTYIRSYIHTCIHIHTYTYTYTCTYIRKKWLGKFGNTITTTEQCVLYR